MIKNIIEYAAMIYGAMEIAYGITSRIRSGNVSKNNKDKGSFVLNLLFLGIGFTISLGIYLGGSGGPDVRRCGLSLCCGCGYRHYRLHCKGRCNTDLKPAIHILCSDLRLSQAL